MTLSFTTPRRFIPAHWSPSYRKLVGYRAMPILVAALRAHDAQFNRTERRVDDTEKAA
jgi:hypothetical protein